MLSGRAKDDDDDDATNPKSGYVQLVLAETCPLR
jgi:hypothetical protein